jgi:hypothetical protein
MASTATATFTLQYTPPSAPTNSGSATFTVTANHNAQNVGQIDVNPADTPPTSFDIPFGSVAKAKILVIKNLLDADVGVRLNAAVADQFQIAAGGEMIYACSAAPATTPVTSALIRTTAAPAAVGFIQFWVLGD